MATKANIILWQSFNFLKKTPLIFFREKTIRKMIEAESPHISKIAEAIKETLAESILPEEIPLVSEIEILRKEYSNSSESIPKWTHEGNIEGKEKISTLAKVGSRSKFWDTLLFKLIRKFTPEVCLELGTCIGLSGAYQAAALKLNGKGNLITLEGSPHRSEISRKTFERLHFQNVKTVEGKFETTLPAILEKHHVDFAFIDGNHKYEPTIKYFRTILPRTAEGGIIVFDDIYYSRGMTKAWEEIKQSSRVTASVDLFVFGIIVIGNAPKGKKHFELNLLKF
jgi:predicted O-methyltransferase YrrM